MEKKEKKAGEFDRGQRSPIFTLGSHYLNLVNPPHADFGPPFHNQKTTSNEQPFNVDQRVESSSATVPSLSPHHLSVDPHESEHNYQSTVAGPSATKCSLSDCVCSIFNLHSSSRYTPDTAAIFSESSHFGLFGSKPFLRMAHLKTCPNLHHLQVGLEICHTNFTST